MESDLSNENEISGIVEDQLIPKPVNLSFYAQHNIPDYQNITEMPQNNLAYLNSGLVASDMSYMFNGCSYLKTIPKLNIDTSKCTNMSYMFQSCHALTSLDLSNFNTSNVANMEYMFRCYALTSLNLSNWNTSNVTSMCGMFYDCESLISLDLSNFNTSKVNNMARMFYDCQLLTSLDLSTFDTSKVTYMSDMFYDCQALEHIEGIIDMKSCSNGSYDGMFYRCDKLSGLKIKNPPQEYYDNKDTFESNIKLTSDQYEIIS